MLEIGDDKSEIGALIGHFDFTDDASGLAPAVGLVAELGKEPYLGRLLRSRLSGFFELVKQVSLG